jgi:hypothetical protein
MARTRQPIKTHWTVFIRDSRFAERFLFASTRVEKSAASTQTARPRAGRTEGGWEKR